MHLLLIITDYGSLNNFLSELVVRMVEDGHIVDVICSNEKVIDFDDRFDYASLGVRIHFLSFPRGYNAYKQFKASVKINNLIRQINPDFIHAHFTSGIFTTVFYKKPSYVIIGTVHGLGSPMMKGIKKYMFKLVELFCFDRLDQIWVLNRFDYNIIRGKNKKKVYMLESAGLGCDLNRFDINNFTFQYLNIRKELNISEKQFVITYTGRFVNFKGFDLVVRSFFELNKRYPSVYKLVLIGGNDPIHQTGLTDLEEKEFLSCQEIVKVGFTDRVERYLSVSDIFLFPSLKEGMPVCIIEALAMGIPVITTDSRGCNDLVKNNVNGILLSNKPTIEQIVEAISLLRNSPDLMSGLKNNAIKNRSMLSRQVYISKQIEVYYNLVQV